MNITVNNSVEELLEYAISTLQEVSSEDNEFTVKDLFRGYEWNRISITNRKELGRQFIAYSKHEGAELLEARGKTPQNQQKYIKL